MKCKPGDLAMIVGDEPSIGTRNYGKLVNVKRPGPEPFTWDIEPLSDLWVVDSLGMCPLPYLVKAGDPLVYHPDAWLQPIRDPGDDARDETLEWKREPEPEVVS